MRNQRKTQSAAQNSRPKQGRPKQRSDAKSLMRSLQLTTAVGAVSLTLGGWGWLSQVEASNAAQLAQDAATKLTLADTSAASVPIANRALAPSVKAPTVVTPTATPGATPAPEANAASAATTQTVKLDIVQWVTTNAGDPVAIVRDTRGVLWYVWGDDVPRIEQGQTPQYQPQPVNARARSRHS